MRLVLANQRLHVHVIDARPLAALFTRLHTNVFVFFRDAINDDGVIHVLATVETVPPKRGTTGAYPSSGARSFRPGIPSRARCLYRWGITRGIPPQSLPAILAIVFERACRAHEFLFIYRYMPGVREDLGLVFHALHVGGPALRARWVLFLLAQASRLGGHGLKRLGLATRSCRGARASGPACSFRRYGGTFDEIMKMN